MLEVIRRNKADILTLLVADYRVWTAEDWQVFYDERAGIAEFDAGLPKAHAEHMAYEQWYSPLLLPI
jgi:hypothetical protein